MNSEKAVLRFAKVYGSPGQGPRTIGPLRVLWPLLPLSLAAGWLLRAALPVPACSTSQAGVLFVLLAVGFALFAGWSARRLRSFLKGAEGEETVARALSFLPAGCTVFNDLQLAPGGPAFDHIVVSPAGLFVIETKNWSGEITFEQGQVLCDGKAPTRSPLKQVKEAAAALMDYLAATGCPAAGIQPVLCFAGNRPNNSPANIGGVRICTEDDLPGLLENGIGNPVPAGTLGMICSELIRCVSDK